MGADAVPADLAPVRSALVERRAAVLDAEFEQRLAAVQADLAAALDRIAGWEVDGDDFEVVQGGFARTYRRARDRMDDAYEEATSEAFHLWRKRVKCHRYHVRLLQDLWPGMLRARRQELHELTDLLRDDHDLAVLRPDLVAEPDRYGGVDGVTTVCALLDRRRAELQAAAEPLGRRCFAAPLVACPRRTQPGRCGRCRDPSRRFGGARPRRWTRRWGRQSGGGGMVAVAGPEGRQRCSLERRSIRDVVLGVLEAAAPGSKQVRSSQPLPAVHCASVAAPQVWHRPHGGRA